MPLEVVKMCKTLINIVEEMGGNDFKPFKVPARASILSLLVEYGEKKRTLFENDANAPSQVFPAFDRNSTCALDRRNEKKEKNCLQQWEHAFFKSMNLPQLIELVVAAEFLDFEELRRTSGAFVALTYIRNKSIAEIRTALGLRNDWSAEARAKFESEHACCHER